MRFAACAVGIAAVWGLAALWPTGALAAVQSHAPPALVAPTPASLFEPKEHDFTVAFPGLPKVGFRLFKDGRERTYLDNEGDRLFMVTASSFLLGARNDDEAYDRRLRQFAANMGATLASRLRINWGGDGGWEWLFTTPQGARILVRMTVHDKRLYQAVYQGVDEDSTTVQGRRFMESFQLLDR